jgi:hypothetical protein
MRQETLQKRTGRGVWKYGQWKVVEFPEEILVCDLGPGAESEGKTSTETAKPRQKFASEPGAVGSYNRE